MSRRALSNVQQRALALVTDGNSGASDAIRSVLRPPRSAKRLRAVTKIVHFHGQRGSWQKVVMLVDRLRAASLQPDKICCNAVISACSRSYQWRAAVAIFSQMLHQRNADAVGLTSVVRACDLSNQWPMGLLFLRVSEHALLAMDTWVYGAAISLCGRASRWGTALGLLGRTRRMHLPLDVVTRAAVLNACERSAAWTHAVQLLTEFLGWGCAGRGTTTAVNVVGWSSVLSACGNARQWAATLGLFERMQEENRDAPIPPQFMQHVHGTQQCIAD